MILLFTFKQIKENITSNEKHLLVVFDISWTWLFYKLLHPQHEVTILKICVCVFLSESKLVWLIKFVLT